MVIKHILFSRTFLSKKHSPGFRWALPAVVPLPREPHGDSNCVLLAPEHLIQYQAFPKILFEFLKMQMLKECKCFFFTLSRGRRQEAGEAPSGWFLPCRHRKCIHRGYLECLFSCCLHDPFILLNDR